MDCGPPGPSVHGILQAWTLEWVAISFSRGSSRPRDRITSTSPDLGGRFFTTEPPRTPICFACCICVILLHSAFFSTQTWALPILTGPLCSRTSFKKKEASQRMPLCKSGTGLGIFHPLSLLLHCSLNRPWAGISLWVGANGPTSTGFL